ncbi:hypothetical protein J1605_009363 [Eschrichtius robustus]|uniref:Uncharacterized protein n=1 Tax=Eschrichtius robustus TaxID=9764 RepID=A0AB34GXB9_ESCRO|nr:hypothetical protein J1605_009363 [Eschrichtius robustus]
MRFSSPGSKVRGPTPSPLLSEPGIRRGSENHSSEGSVLRRGPYRRAKSEVSEGRQGRGRSTGDEESLAILRSPGDTASGMRPQATLAGPASDPAPPAPSPRDGPLLPPTSLSDPPLRVLMPGITSLSWSLRTATLRRLCSPHTRPGRPARSSPTQMQGECLSPHGRTAGLRTLGWTEGTAHVLPRLAVALPQGPGLPAELIVPGSTKAACTRRPPAPTLKPCSDPTLPGLPRGRPPRQAHAALPPAVEREPEPSSPATRTTLCGARAL